MQPSRDTGPLRYDLKINAQRRPSELQIESSRFPNINRYQRQQEYPFPGEDMYVYPVQNDPSSFLDPSHLRQEPAEGATAGQSSSHFQQPASRWDYDMNMSQAGAAPGGIAGDLGPGAPNMASMRSHYINPQYTYSYSAPMQQQVTTPQTPLILGPPPTNSTDLKIVGFVPAKGRPGMPLIVQFLKQGFDPSFTYNIIFGTSAIVPGHYRVQNDSSPIITCIIPPLPSDTQGIEVQVSAFNGNDTEVARLRVGTFTFKTAQRARSRSDSLILQSPYYGRNNSGSLTESEIQNTSGYIGSNYTYGTDQPAYLFSSIGQQQPQSAIFQAESYQQAAIPRSIQPTSLFNASNVEISSRSNSVDFASVSQILTSEQIRKLRAVNHDLVKFRLQQWMTRFPNANAASVKVREDIAWGTDIVQDLLHPCMYRLTFSDLPERDEIAKSSKAHLIRLIEKALPNPAERDLLYHNLKDIDFDSDLDNITRPELHIQGNLASVPYDWSPEETSEGRRLVQYKVLRQGRHVQVTFTPLIHDRNRDAEAHGLVSCVFAPMIRTTPESQPGTYIITSVDLVCILESIFSSMNTKEKNRCRRNLECCDPRTVSQEGFLGDFWTQLCDYKDPKVMKITKATKVFLWSFLTDALQRICEKYGVLWGCDSHMIEALQQEVDKTDKSYPSSQSPPNMPNKRIFQSSVDSSGLLSGKKRFSEPPPSLPPPMRSSVYAPNQFQGPMRQLPLPSPPTSSTSMESNASAMIPGIGQPRQAAYPTVMSQQQTYGIDTSGMPTFMPTSPSAMSSTMPSTSTTPSLSGRTFAQYVHQQQPSNRFVYDYTAQATTEPSAQSRAKQNEPAATTASSNTPTPLPASGSSPSTRSSRRNQQESPVEDQQVIAAKPVPITGTEWPTWDQAE